MPEPATPRSRFVESPCWIWLGATNSEGYGALSSKRIHCETWEAVNGRVPRGYVLHHLCRTKLCYRPSHLLCLTRGQHTALHMQDKLLWTHCANGHPYSEKRDARGHRWCRVCQREKADAWRRRNIAVVRKRDNERKRACRAALLKEIGLD